MSDPSVAPSGVVLPADLSEIDGVLFVDGRLVAPASGKVIALTEPASGRPLLSAAVGSPQDVDRAVAAASTAMAGRWGRTSATARGRLLHALADAVERELPALAELEARNVGKAIAAVSAEIAATIETFRYYASVAGAIGGRANPIGGSVQFHTARQPVGVAGQIIPWNFPFMLAGWKLAPALAAGCAVVLKVDQLTPATALRLALLCREVGIPDGVVNVVPGDGPVTGAHLVAHTDVAKISFTGSTRTGVAVAQSAAETMKRVTLELGGKSPNLVFADADLDAAVPSSVWAVFNSAGQSCEARSRLLVERPIYDAFLERFLAATKALRVGDPLDPATQVGSLISRAHRDRVHGMIERAAQAGARVACGGAVPPGEGAFYPPTVICDAGDGSEIAREEVFGPLVTIAPFVDEAEAVARANDTRYGLMATVWTGDPARGQRVARLLDAGTVGVNTAYSSFPGVPYGGFKESGIGREVGVEALDAYLETKSVVVWTGARPSLPPSAG